MAKIYDFPQGSDRIRLKREIASQRKEQLNVKAGRPVLKYIKLCWFYLRLLAAGVMHSISVVALAILAAFSKAIFCIGGLFCVITWFHLEHQFWTPHNFTIPVIVTLWGVSLFAAPLMQLLNKKMPWYRLLVPDAKDASIEATYDEAQ
ncbi:hypothetical protein [Pantoea agglomerans]